MEEKTLTFEKEGNTTRVLRDGFIIGKVKKINCKRFFFPEEEFDYTFNELQQIISSK